MLHLMGGLQNGRKLGGGFYGLGSPHPSPSSRVNVLRNRVIRAQPLPAFALAGASALAS